MNQGSHSAVIHGVYGSSSQLVDLPVQEPEDGSQEGNFPDGSQLWDNSGSVEGNRPDGKSSEGNSTVDEDGWYSSKEEVALYIHLYGDLPDNYVTKDEAEDAGWSGGNVEYYTGEGTAIGGSRFGNREGLLPKEQGRTYTECDIDTVGENSRGAKRIVFSNDGLVYYTDDHYESFELLYGEP
ncbi:MAG: ribonuclease [Lawsonibacter sp.]|nr:ribonuclease [Lawsonibacter sp.]